MLPFEFYSFEGNGKTFLDLINSLFGYNFDTERFEITTETIPKSNLSFYIGLKEAGFTFFKSNESFNVSLFALDLDGNADGISQTLTFRKDQFFVFKNHPSAYFKFDSNSRIEVVYYKLKDELSLSTDQFSAEALSKNIAEIHLNDEAIKKYSDEFYEKSMITLKNVLPNPSNSFCNVDSWKRAGPADYRSFKYNTDSAHLIHNLMKSKEFMAWLSAITGLPLLFPSLPIYTRCIQAAGDYQILHGNYSEPFGLDVIYNFSLQNDGKEWNEKSCGLIHYLNDSGDEIFQVSPIFNSLTIVYRTEGCSRFTENVKGFSEMILLQTISIYSVSADE